MTKAADNFVDLGLSEPLLKALRQVGYETPSPIQAASIPPLLAGRDILGQAQTGTGKTAAFALPLLQQLNLRQKSPQILVLAPTRELAIQVSEAFQKYAHYLSGFHVLPIYGGQSYSGQLRALKRGVQVVVGTPGRVMDHMRKGTLKLDDLKHLVLDEADEMLRMGFIDDVEWVLSQLPEKRQIALFSATMPKAIEKVANTYLNDPAQVQIKMSTTTASQIKQFYWPVTGVHKLDALTRILEAEEFDGMIVFVRTKASTTELSEKLSARGFSTAALNGDISQAVRETTIKKLKQGKIDILVATDVAARGLDVDRISHVINYDIPYDTEAYVHRIGRTGRAGREGKGILFVANRERRMLRAIEKATRQKIEVMQLPSTDVINAQRAQRFKEKILETLAAENLDDFTRLIEEVRNDAQEDPVRIAAALAKIGQGEQPLFISEKRREHSAPQSDPEKRRQRHDHPDVPMETYRIEVGRRDQVTPGQIVGAIANQADIEGQFIGHVKIHDDYSTVDLPAEMPAEIFQILRKTWVCQKKLNLRLVKKSEGSGSGPRRNEGKKKSKAKKMGKKRKVRSS